MKKPPLKAETPADQMPREEDPRQDIPQFTEPEKKDPVEVKIDRLLKLVEDQSARIETLEAKQAKKVTTAGSAASVESGDEPLEEVFIDLPTSGGISIKVNGFDFFHGQTYRVTHNQKVSLMDNMACAWRHEDEIHGKNTEEYRRARNVRLGQR